MLKRPTFLFVFPVLAAAGCATDRYRDFMIDTVAQCRRQRLEVDGFEMTPAHNRLVLEDHQLSVGVKTCSDAWLAAVAEAKAAAETAKTKRVAAATAVKAASLAATATRAAEAVVRVKEEAERAAKAVTPDGASARAALIKAREAEAIASVRAEAAVAAEDSATAHANAAAKAAANQGKACAAAMRLLQTGREDLMRAIRDVRRLRLPVDSFDYDPAGKLLSLTEAGKLSHK